VANQRSFCFGTGIGIGIGIGPLFMLDVAPVSNCPPHR
jgi:hypothetical protein